MTTGLFYKRMTLTKLTPTTRSFGICRARSGRPLEQNRDAKSESAQTHFLVGYHYLMLNHTDAARTELSKIVELEPRDKLAAELLKLVRRIVP